MNKVRVGPCILSWVLKLVISCEQKRKIVSQKFRPLLSDDAYDVFLVKNKVPVLVERQNFKFKQIILIIKN